MKSDKSSKTAVIIVAAGRGERAGQSQGPKQYRSLGPKPMLWHTVIAFRQNGNVGHIQIVIHPDDDDLYKDCALNSDKLLPPVNGGATRQDSVAAGLDAIDSLSPDNVLIHDAARPMVSSDLIDRVIEGLATNPAVLPAVAIADTLKRGNSDQEVVETIPRENLFAAQTPQGFHYRPLLAAHRKAQSVDLHNFTDDSALAEWAGMTVQLVDGSTDNTKITTVDDLRKAHMTMSQATVGLPDVRVGHGYDTHQWVDGDSVWLCGLEVPHTHRLSGHSDADVGLHALTDALLAAIADGDIGSHFPPSDAKWKDARSDQFLKHAISRVENAGGTVTHMDVTLICEAPKIGPHRDAMREAISAISGVSVNRISVKATTNERIGFVGREEGMVAVATATVVMGML